MEASGLRARRRLVAERVAAPAREVGDLAGFSARATVAAAGTGRYFAEILRQCALLILGSTLILVTLVMVIGGECGLFVTYLTRPLGANSFTGQGLIQCGLRGMFYYMFAYIFAAKVGCGLVAEVGSMRISDEIAALESVGIDPMRYVIGTRLLAVWICAPLIFALGLVAGVWGGYLVAVVQLGNLSAGQYFDGYFAAQTIQDNFFAFVNMFAMVTVISVVGLYYGYRASGGPVGVGDAVARSMMVNLVLIHVVGAFFASIFYGVDARYPFGG